MGNELQRSTVEKAFATFEQMERPLHEALLSFLSSRSDVQVPSN